MALNIAITGAGPAGCTLALLLLKSPRPISVTIFEGEASFDARTQGGTLDLHDKTGLLALRRAGLYDNFLQYARFDGEALIVADKNMKRYINLGGTDPSKSRGRPEIDRKALRQLLLDALPEGIVKWGHRLRSITADGPLPTDLTMNFEHTSLNGFDLIIGADGAYSRIRPLVSDVQPYFSGVGCIRMGISDVATNAPEIHTLVNRGSIFAFGDHKGLMPQQLGDGTMSYYAMLTQTSPLWLKTAPWNNQNDTEAIKAALLEEYKDWDPQLQSIIAKSDLQPSVSNLNMLPIGHSWEHRPGVTLMGDAAHVMTPFAGEGVNLAMQDALKLSEAIINASSSTSPQDALSPAVSAFEKDMFVRATKVQNTTYNMMRLMLLDSTSPAEAIEEWVLWAASADCPSILYPFLYAAVYAYFIYFRVWDRFWAVPNKM